MTTEAFWRAVLARLDAGEPVFIALVVANTHGSPGTLGARLLVDVHGAAEGTIGGAIMEARLVENARSRLQTRDDAPVLQTLVHSKKKTRFGQPSGLICAGRQTNLSLVLDPRRDAAAVRRFYTAITEPAAGAAILIIDSQGLRVQADAAGDSEPGMRLSEEGASWHFQESSLAPSRLAVVGGGHCGKALANLALQAGYWVDVYDNRPAVLEGEAWQPEVRRHALQDYAELHAHLAYPQLTTTVVMTAAVVHDIAALAAIAHLPLPWLGVMGSVAKIHEIQSQLRARGVAEADIERIHGPIGLPMKSDTPPEIAISIMGQLLQQRQ
ncbi:MAG TPA: XdhC family protein [Salinisphaeraceae bacterium]|nr:XdhC family protein [Salinisphaeraceae bacterium]